jgi:hypothetical protein
MEDFIRDWKSTNSSIFPVLRNLFPDYDTQRSASGYQESRLASLYCELLVLPEKGENRRKLENWKDAAVNGAKAGNFGAVLQGVLRNYKHTINPTSTLTIDQVNDLIDAFLFAKERYNESMIIGVESMMQCLKYLRIVRRENKY